MTIRAAQQAIEAGDFAGALDALGDGESAGTPAWLELRANAAYGHGAYEDAVAAWEQLHALHRSAGQPVDAARAAVMTAMLLLIDGGMLSTVRGWVQRAQRMLDGLDETPVHALIAAASTYERFFTGDIERSAAWAADAVERGERMGVMAAVAIGRTALGRVAILRGDVDDGLAQLDEVAALLMSGEVDSLTTGIMLCELVCAAQSVLRTDLAREWTDIMARWSVSGALGAIRGRCRVHQAELLRVSGPSDAAEREALQACEELRPWLRREYGWPLVELGLTRLRRGDLHGAEEAFAAAGEHTWPTHPGRALLELERGRPDAAASQIRHAIAHPIDAPSKELPPFGDLRLVPLLDAQSEIAAAASDLATAAQAADELRRIAAVFRSPAIQATADLATARHALMSGDPGAAMTAAAAARTTFSALDALYDRARAGDVLAGALEAAGDDSARLEREATRADYARYGALRRAAALGGTGGAEMIVAPESPSVRRDGALCRSGQVWTIEFGGRSAQLKDLKGLRYLHRLLSEPGREFHVLDLVAVEAGTVRVQGADAGGIPVLDDTARAAYRRRLADIDDDIEEAARNNDSARLAKAEADREYLVSELARAVGIGGRARHTGDSSERARTAVARTLRYALDEMAVHHREAAAHLRASIRTGTYCRYEPDELAGVTWRTR
ncbi:MAG: hypothetical protein AB7L13_15090 [Acidimicrobiia bacterium]